MRQRIKAAWLEAGRDNEVACAFRRRFGEERCFDFPETLIAKLIAWPLGGVSTLVAVWLGILIVIIALVVLALLGRRRQARAQAARGS